ncbi:MAG TPA: arsenical resistance protein ArsH, partial [Alteromonas macleodii]|nr:arsenical resistance protein ArsH [Alteromonas macleodii]
MGNSKSMSQDISSNQESSTAQSPSDNAVMAQMHKPIMANFASRFSDHKPRILLLYGSLRERSYSRLVIEESARLLEYFGAEAKIFDPRGLPQPDTEDDSHPKVKELRE